MTEQEDNLLSASQLAALRESFHHGSALASTTLAKWIGKSSVVEIDSLEQLPLAEATEVLGVGDVPVCFCAVQMTGWLAGELVLAFDEASGLALADMLLDQPETTEQWTELAESAVLETTNILCCAYLNALSSRLSDVPDFTEILPTPPRFDRDFAESLLEFALMGQAVAGDYVVLAKTKFEIDATPLNWTLLFLPDAPSMLRLLQVLDDSHGAR